MCACTLIERENDYKWQQRVQGELMRSVITFIFSQIHIYISLLNIILLKKNVKIMYNIYHNKSNISRNKTDKFYIVQQ